MEEEEEELVINEGEAYLRWGGKKVTSCMGRHRNHAFSFWDFALLYISPTID